MECSPMAFLAVLLLGPLVVAAEGPAVPDVLLSNGVRMPAMAFAAQVWDAETCKSATANALQVGFRFIWSSALVGTPCQKAQHQAIVASSVPRDALFVAGTVNTQSCSDADDCYKETKDGAADQLNIMSPEGRKLDMLMLDYPAAAGCDAIAGQWRALEELYKEGKVRCIAVSNFGPKQLECVKAHHSEVLPAVNQMPFSVGHGKDNVVSDDAVFGTVVQAYSPLGSGGVAHDALCTNIGKSHGKSAVQVALRWIIQRNVSIATQSTNPGHLRDDLDIFDFSLSDQDMAQLNSHQGSLGSPVLV